MEQLLITATDAAKALSISERTLYAMAKAGQIPCVRMGRVVRFVPTQLKEWLAEKKQEAQHQVNRILANGKLLASRGHLG